MYDNTRRLIDFYIAQLRNGGIAYEMMLSGLRKELARAELSLQDVGISADDLEKWRVASCKTEARYWLDYLRRGTIMHKAALASLRSLLADGNITLQDIGCTKPELEMIIKSNESNFELNLRKKTPFRSYAALEVYRTNACVLHEATAHIGLPMRAVFFCIELTNPFHFVHCSQFFF